jgi:hypothetical protein
MNRYERLIYDLVKGNPALKKKIRNIYQSIFDLLPRPEDKSAYPITQRKGYFFGFHDHTPFSADNLKMLSNRATGDLYMPKNNQPLEVGFFDGQDFKNFNPITTTNAWNWHMGCKLQWRGNSNEIIFNDHIGGSNISRMINLDSSEEKKFSSSIASVSPDGEWAIGYSFERVNELMPGYGYTHKVEEDDLDQYRPKKTGIYKINLSNGNKQELINIHDLANIKTVQSMENAKHFFSHVVISPDSAQFMFLHRWKDPNGDIDKRFSRLVIADLSGKIIDILVTNEMVSHIGWKDSEHIIAYCRVPIYDDKYILFKVNNPERSIVIGNNKLTSDGHPSYEKSGRWIVTDTYPDRRRIQNLILFDTKTETRYDIAKLFNPKKFQSPSAYQHWACDLHPRWSRDSRILCFDATFEGRRSLCTIDLGNDILENNLKYLTKV